MSKINWSQRSVWIVGASSGIGKALASALHHRGAKVTVSARSENLLNDFVKSHPGSWSYALDANDSEQMQQAATSIQAQQGLDWVVYCAGYYKAVRANRFSADEMRHHMDVNYFGAVNLIEAALPKLMLQGHGHLSFVSSVAGFRGLPLSLAYGPSKAALTHMAEVLYLDLKPQGIDVSVIHPGFVETNLTANNKFKMPALISPEEAAKEIINGWDRGVFEIHFPKRFTRFLKLLRLLPDRLYFSLIHKATKL